VKKGLGVKSVRDISSETAGWSESYRTPIPGILWPSDDLEVQRDDELGVFADDEAAAKFFAYYTGLPVRESEDGKFFVDVPEEDIPWLRKVIAEQWKRKT